MSKSNQIKFERILITIAGAELSLTHMQAQEQRDMLVDLYIKPLVDVNMLANGSGTVTVTSEQCPIYPGAS
jgi:hypothetical protein